VAIELDAIDRRIAALLEEDGRMTASEIARRVRGVSERAVRYRVDRLRSSGVLRITALLDPVALGYTTIGEVLIDVAPNRLQDVAAELVKIDECEP